MEYSLFDILGIVSIAILLVIVGVYVSYVLYMILRYIIGKNDYIDMKTDNEEFQSIINEYDGKIKMVEYSDKYLEFVKKIIGQITIMKFRTFTDGHQLSKVTSKNIENLIGEIAIDVKKSLESENIELNKLIFSTEFYDSFIIETIIILVKEMLEKAANNELEL